MNTQPILNKPKITVGRDLKITLHAGTGEVSQTLTLDEALGFVTLLTFAIRENVFAQSKVSEAAK